jgi:hypothetical protein
MERMRILMPFLAGALAAQTLVVDRPPSASPERVKVERADGKFVGDSFRVGKEGEVWMIERIRLWAVAPAGQACGRALGDSVEKVTLLGTIDNPPVPGQPVCDCHAVMPLATAPFAKGQSEPVAENIDVARRGDGLWEFDFRNVRWSLPGGSDVLFTLRAVGRGKMCPISTEWSMAGAPAAAGYRLHLLNEKGVPIGPADPEPRPRTAGIQVWARRTQP